MHAGMLEELRRAYSAKHHQCGRYAPNRYVTLLFSIFLKQSIHSTFGLLSILFGIQIQGQIKVLLNRVYF